MTLMELLAAINAKKKDVQNLVDADKLDEAKSAKEELVKLQNKYDLLQDIIAGEESGAGNGTTGRTQVNVTENAAIHEFANAVRSKFRNATY